MRRSPVSKQVRATKSGARLAVDDRRAERLRLELPLTYAFRQGRSLVRGQTVTTNLSGSGLRFFANQLAVRGSDCRISLRLPSRPQPICFVGRISWCRLARSKSCFEIAVTFSGEDAASSVMFNEYCHFIATQLLAKYLS